MEPINTKYGVKGVVDSRIGGRNENQDYYGYCDTPLGLAVVLCDGMGGLQGGQIASSVAVNSILSNLLAFESPEKSDEILRKVIKKANADVLQAAADSGIVGMGTTVTVLVINEKSAIVAHLGASRIYQLRGRSKHFRTFDHSMVFEMVKTGVLTEEQARLSENSNIITKGLGIFPDVEPDVQELPYESGDRFVLCSDGIWGSMKEDSLVSMFSQKSQLGNVVRIITEKVEKIGKAKGGHHDNMTIALLEMTKDSKLKEKMNKKARIIICLLSVLLAASIVGNVVQFMSDNSVKSVKVEEKNVHAKDSVDNNDSHQQNQDEPQKTKDESQVEHETGTEPAETSNEAESSN